MMQDWSPEEDRNAMYAALTEPWYLEYCYRKGSHRGQPMIPKTDEQRRWASEGPVPLHKQDNVPCRSE
jgi:hypothetical protein